MGENCPYDRVKTFLKFAKVYNGSNIHFFFELHIMFSYFSDSTFRFLYNYVNEYGLYVN